LLCSLVLRPAIEPARAGLLSLLAGAAVAEAARQAAGVLATCKWPNDLLIGERKAGGILAESDVAEGSLRFVVLGLGANLAVPADVPGATGLGEDVDPVALLGSFLSAFRDGYRPQEAGFATGVIARWTAVASTLGREVAATTIGGEAIRGEAVGVDEAGSLIVRGHDGAETAVGFGEVRHLS
jgi:BirA family biotin operon repressor/biotin-[acetyl-CoA-carboxylase] ligase